MEWILDRLLPAYEFRTRYTRRVAADTEAVWAALQQVTYAELPVTRVLMAVRSGGRGRLSGRVTETSPMPVLGLAEGRESVVGRVARFWQPRPVAAEVTDFAAFAEPGWAKAAMSFQLTPLPGGGTLLAAETRVHATDKAAYRAFRPYWALIRAGGAGFIRLELLRAIARRAERLSSPSPESQVSSRSPEGQVS